MRSISVKKAHAQTLGVSILIEVEKVNKDHTLGRGEGAYVVKTVVPTKFEQNIGLGLGSIYHVIEADVFIELE